MQGVIVESLLLLQCPAWGHPGSVPDCRHLESPPSVCTGLEHLVFVPVVLILHGDGTAGLNVFRETVSPQARHVGLVYFVPVLVILHEPVCNLESRIDELYPVLGLLQHRLPSDLDELVNIAEARGRLARGYGVTHSVRVNLRPLALEISDEIFVKGIGSEYLAARKSMGVKYFPDLNREICKVSAVEPDAVSVRI